MPMGALANEPFFPTKKGMTLVTFNYDAKGKKTPRDIRATVKDVEGTDGNMTVTYSVRVAAKPERNGEYKVKIADGAVLYDATWFRRNDVVAVGEYIRIPADMSPGTKLANDEAIFKSRDKAGNPNKERARLAISNHKCVSIEKITVPAGTFECYKVTYSMNGSLNVVIDINVNGTGEVYYARGVGIVKMVTYDAKGKIQSRSELQSITM